MPLPLTPLVGRGQELAQVCALLRREVRLLSLIGPGGSGKTRLALAVAMELHDAFRDGVAFIDLAPVSDAVLVCSAIAAGLGVREVEGQRLSDTLAPALRELQLLLLLDNFEQVSAAAPEVAALLATCPGLKILVTSRAALRVYGEHEFPVPPLALPEAKSAASADALIHVEAVALFVARARAARPDFQLTDANAPIVADVCRRLDGLPLAIELAAARVKLLSPQALLERLDSARHGSPLLAAGPHNLPARQQTLRATLNWSYALLTQPERTLFHQLSVFLGGFTLEAAETVVGNAERPIPLLDRLGSLVDKSLVRRAETADEEIRFGMLETIREYAEEWLEASGRAEETRRRHAEYFLALAEEAAPQLRGPRQTTWLSRLEREHGNLRAALRWALEGGEAELAVRLGTALWRFWWALGHLGEGRRWLEGLLASAGALSASVRSRALSGAGALAPHALTRDPMGAERVQAFFAESLALCRELGDTRGVALALGNLGHIAVSQGDAARGMLLLGESLALFRELGNQERIATALYNLGAAILRVGDHVGATATLEESLALRRELGDQPAIAMSLAALGGAAHARGDREGARVRFSEALTVSGELGPSPAVAEAIEGLAWLAGALAQPMQAAKLFGAAEALCESIGMPARPRHQTARADDTAAVRAMLGESAFSTAWAEGRSLSFQEAIDLALSIAATGRSPARPSTDDDRAAPLSPREREVAVLLARGFTNREIADQLVIAEGTSERHVANILNKLGLSSRAQVAVWVVERGLLPPEPR